jgi:hypothetical protein
VALPKADAHWDWNQAGTLNIGFPQVKGPVCQSSVLFGLLSSAFCILKKKEKEKWPEAFSG